MNPPNLLGKVGEIMDEISARLVYLLTDLILPLIVGYLLYRRQLLTDTAVNRLIRINVVVFFTLLSLFSFWALPLTHDLLMLPAFFAFIILFPGFLSWRFLGRRFHSPINRGTHPRCDQRDAHGASLSPQRRLYDCRLPCHHRSLSHDPIPCDIFPVSVERSISYGQS